MAALRGPAIASNTIEGIAPSKLATLVVFVPVAILELLQFTAGTLPTYGR